MTSVLATPPFLAFYDDDGEPLSGGLVYTYAAGTTTPKATFTDVTATVEQTNPIVLDASGRATWWISGAYKYVIKDSLGNTIKTTDNVTSFTTLAEASDAFFQSFSGTGSQTAFTLSTDLGTDSKNLMVFVNSGLAEHVTNGTFATDTDWTKGAGWSIGSGVATATGAISTALSQTSDITLVEGQAYALTYVVTRSAGGVIPSIGGTDGTERTASGTYHEVIIAGSSQTLAFTGNAFTGTVDTITITVASSAGYDIQNPAAYTVSGTALTFASAPATGTNNIFVFSPSTLVGAASSAAAAAEASAAQALTSETNAANSASLAALTIKWRPAVAVATTANITLSGEQTIDGVLTSASRILVKDQTAAEENGVYVTAAGAWARATDADTWDELVGQAVTSTGGTVNENKSFANTNETGGTLETTAVTWTELLIYPAANSVSTESIQDGAVTAAKLAVSLGGVNILDNGDFIIAARGSTFTSASVPANSDDTYLLDRWILLSDGNDIVDVSKETTFVPTGGRSAIKFEVETANKKFGKLQPVEFSRCAHVIGGTVSLSFQAAKAVGNATLDKIRAAVVSWDSTADSLTSDIVSAWGAEGADPTLVANWTYENTPSDLTLTDAYQTFTLENIDIDTASTKNIGVFFWLDNDDATVNDLLYASNFMLVSGAAASSFVPKPIQEEIANCARYRWQVVADGNSYLVGAGGRCLSSTVARITNVFPFPMRSEITGITTSTASGFNVVNGINNPIDGTAISLGAANTLAAEIAVTVASGLTANDSVGLWLDSGAYIYFDGGDL